MSRGIWLYHAALLSSTVPVLVREVKHEQWEIVRVLRALLEEGISIRDMTSILGELCSRHEVIQANMSEEIIYGVTGGGPVIPSSSRASDDEVGPEGLLSLVRVSLKRHISMVFTGGGAKIVVYLVDRSIERNILDIEESSFVEGDEEQYCSAARKVLGQLEVARLNPVILTTMEVRRRLRRIFSLEFPHIQVLAYQELTPDIDIHPVARIESA